jgi:arylsulfatase A-like enzyme
VSPTSKVNASIQMHRPSAPQLAAAASRGAAFGAALLALEELTNLVMEQPALSLTEVLTIGAWYAGAMMLLGLLLAWLREPVAHLLGLLALTGGFMAAGKLSEEIWWSGTSQITASWVGYPTAFAVCIGGLWGVLRLTAQRPALRVGLLVGGLIFVPAFRAMNINAFGTATAPGAVQADLVVLGIASVAGLVALRASRVLSAHPGRALTALLALCTVSTGLGRALTTERLPPPAPASDSPDVLLIIVDTLRADHIGAYGYEHPVSPTLDAFSEQAVVFEQAGSPASWTLPAFGAFMTGQYPSGHGAGHNDGERNTQSPLRSDIPTLAERMAAAGYRTGGIVTNPYLKRSFGISRGFETYSDALGLAHMPMFVQPLRMLTIPVMGGRYFYRPADLMVDEAIAWWQAMSGGPRFLMLHLMDPHDPYNPPSKDLAAVGQRHADPDENAYDAEIRFTDREIGRLLEQVDLSRTWVIITSDHGDSFGEHEGAYAHENFPHTRHGHTLYQELLHVPLIVAGPDTEPGRVSRVVRAFDVVPTLLQAAGAQPIEGPAQHLFQATTETAAGAQAMRFGTEKSAVRLGKMKLIRTREGDELYDLSEDPAELNNLAPSSPSIVTDLEPYLPAAGEQTQAPTLDAETRSQLEALGYVQ